MGKFWFQGKVQTWGELGSLTYINNAGINTWVYSYIRYKLRMAKVFRDRVALIQIVYGKLPVLIRTIHIYVSDLILQS